MRDVSLSEQAAADASARLRRGLVLAGKALLSVVVLGWLVAELDRARLATVATAAAPAWLLLAFGLKVGSLVLHEVRTWFPLPQPRPPLWGTVRLCLGIGLLNLVIPARAGDIGIIAALNRRYGVPLSRATAVVGVTSFLEALVFAAILLATLFVSTVAGTRAVDELSPFGAPAAGGLVAEGAAAEAAALLGVGAAGAAVGVVVVVLLGRGLRRRSRPDGVLGVLVGIIIDTADLLTSPVVMVRNSALALVQVGLLVAAFAVGLPAAGVTGIDELAVAAQVLAISSLASVLLPPSWGVGPAAASRFVLGAHGVGAEEAFVYAGIYWLVAHVPFLAVGLPSLWWGRDDEEEDRGDRQRGGV